MNDYHLEQDVKISAAQMLQNMKHANGTAFIPSGALVYISTDDPDGVCLNCAVKGKLCKDMKSPKPIGCPEDVSYIGSRNSSENTEFVHLLRFTHLLL